MKTNLLIAIGVLSLVITFILVGILLQNKPLTENTTSRHTINNNANQLTNEDALPLETKTKNRKPPFRQTKKHHTIHTESAEKSQKHALKTKEKHLKKILARNESVITTETLDDGTELIHLNGAFAHVSAASISEEGDLHVNCHDNHDSLKEQTNPPPTQQATR